MNTIKGIGVSPPESLNLTQKSVGGMKVPELKTGLVKLQVVCPGTIKEPSWQQTLRPGDFIYVPGEAIAGSLWAKNVYEVDGLRFVIVPPEFIQGFKSID